jgi:hypothetical protein
MPITNLTCGLPWRHPAVILAVAIVFIGLAAIYIETFVLPPDSPYTPFAQKNLLLTIASIAGSVLWAYLVLCMIAWPFEYLPNRSLTLPSDIYERREKIMIGLGYLLEVITILFGMYIVYRDLAYMQTL